MCCETMKKKVQKIPVERPKPLSHNKNRQSLLHFIEGGWYINKLSKKILPLKKQKLNHKTNEKEDEMKRNL